MKTAVIVDDEHLAIEELKYLLSFREEIELVNTFTNPIAAEQYIKQSPPDIVFLDIQMPRKSGLEIAKEILKFVPKVKIIFLTAHVTYAIDAFAVNAVDYLLKPTDKERLDIALNKIITLNDKTHIDKSSNRSFISLYSKGSFRPVKYEDILYCKSDDGIVTIHTKNNKFNYTGTLSHLEEILISPCFFRCHRSYIVNLEHIEKIEPTERTYTLKMHFKNELIPVSRSNASQFRMIMSIY
ncbi:MAG: LytTR family DNA-binding domain-containing protein [Bacillota bacterium]|nr:LytTR family DNA-binding domain-containing protein [Bacillota bacterium]